MRKTAAVTKPGAAAKRAMIYAPGAPEEGAFVFEFTSEGDGPAHTDSWFDTLAEAETYAANELGIAGGGWKSVDDPQEGCIPEWLAPVRQKTGAAGEPLFGEFQKLVGGAWVDIPPGEIAH